MSLANILLFTASTLFCMNAYVLKKRQVLSTQGGEKEIFCPENSYMASMDYFNEYEDWKQVNIGCRKVPNANFWVSTQEGIWANYDEEGKSSCPDNHVATGVICAGRDCKKPHFYCKKITHLTKHVQWFTGDQCKWSKFYSETAKSPSKDENVIQQGIDIPRCSTKDVYSGLNHAVRGIKCQGEKCLDFQVLCCAPSQVW